MKFSKNKNNVSVSILYLQVISIKNHFFFKFSIIQFYSSTKFFKFFKWIFTNWKTGILIDFHLVSKVFPPFHSKFLGQKKNKKIGIKTIKYLSWERIELEKKKTNFRNKRQKA